MIPKWMKTIYISVLSSGDIAYYKEKDRFEVRYYFHEQLHMFRHLIGDSKCLGTICYQPGVKLLVEGKNWDDEGNVIENSCTGDIL